MVRVRFDEDSSTGALVECGRVRHWAGWGQARMDDDLMRIWGGAPNR